ncbi:MAG: hypothetical protein RI885_2690 [Actinomycetota bacterium]|jgi:hypothetical protein
MSIRHRLAAAIGIALFLVLAGTGASSALWSSQSSISTSGTGIASGTINVRQSGFNGLAKTYNASLVDNATITVTNSGTVTAPHSFALGVQTQNTLSAAVLVRTWPQTAAACTVATPPAVATTSSWNDIPALTSTLAPAASAVYCVRTSVTSAQQTSLAGQSMVGTGSVTSTLGTWTRTVAITSITQNVADTAAPSVPAAPTASATTNTTTTLTWPASSDNVGVTRYELQRDGGTPVSVTSTSYTDSTLVAGTTYTYRVRAIDAAGNASAYSATTSVTTTAISSTAWYRITNPNSGLCVDGRGSGTANGTALIIQTCSTATSQQWQFVATTNGFYKVVPRNIPSSAWDVSGVSVADGALVQLWNYGGAANQQWRVQQEAGGLFSFVNRNSSKCLDINGRSTTPDTQLQQFTCNSTPAQTFSLTVVG